MSMAYNGKLAEPPGFDVVKYMGGCWIAAIYSSKDYAPCAKINGKERISLYIF
jgi:hypothetical protein